MPKMIGKKALVLEALLRLVIAVVALIAVFKIGNIVAQSISGGKDATQSFDDFVDDLNSKNEFESRPVFLSLDKNTAEFYDNLDRQMLAQFNPFVEPVFLKSKIEGCVGVFGSAIPSDSVLFIYPE